MRTFCRCVDSVGVLLLSLPLFSFTAAEQWPYNRYDGVESNGGHQAPNLKKPEFNEEPSNLFMTWLTGVVTKDASGELKKIFINETIPEGLSMDKLIDVMDIPEEPPMPTDLPISIPSHINDPTAEPLAVLSHLKHPLDPRCISQHATWWYRTYDGSCNWLKAGESDIGQFGTARARDYGQTSFADGISKPREGPNPRAVSNAFFKRKETIYYEHTPLLLGLIEFIMHDVTYSKDSTEDPIEVPMPADETEYHQGTLFKVRRTSSDPTTGNSAGSPRQILNHATTWLDLSALYGSTREVALKLRSFKGGKLLTQMSTHMDHLGEYLPFNTMDVPTNARPGDKAEDLFAGGDARTNEDWILLAVHTLLLREHNRLCGILAKKHPEYDDEQLFQTVRLILSAKYALIANSYQMAYWTKDMPWPRDDGYPLYRQMYGVTSTVINPANTYPWPLVTRGDKPMVVSAEMGVVYRFHEFIVSQFPIKNAKNETLWEQNLFDTAFDTQGFLDVGLESILRGVVASYIPNFKSGVDEAFRSAGSMNSNKTYRGNPFDIVTWSVVHEREQGLPTFNEYFKAYNSQGPAVKVPIRRRFEDFSSDKEAVRKLKELYKNPNDVDLVVGVQLDEEMFPGTTVPKSALITSLFSLFGMGNSDRFSIGFAMMRCFLVDKPWDCHPSNALEDILWAPQPSEKYPNSRMLDPFWMTELDIQAHGTNLLWRLVTENTNVQCLQKNPLFPYHPTDNPVLCEQPRETRWYLISTALVSAQQILGALIKQSRWGILGTLVSTITFIFSSVFRRRSRLPTLRGWPVIGVALQFRDDPLKLLQQGLNQFGNKVFGIRLASLTHYVVTKPEDLEAIPKDEYEVRFSLHEFLRAINCDLITLKENFESDLHTRLIRTWLCDPSNLKRLAPIIDHSARDFLEMNALTQKVGDEVQLDGLNSYFTRLISYVVSRCVVGPAGFDNEELLQRFIHFNDKAVNTMGRAALFPSFLKFIPKYMIQKEFNAIRKLLIGVIERRRNKLPSEDEREADFMKFAIPFVDDQRMADLITITVWAGLTNLQSTFSSTAWDIINKPGLQHTLDPVRNADPTTLSVLDRQEPWTILRSAMFESIRLCGPITGPARMVTAAYPLPSEPSMSIPEGQVLTLSSYHAHRQESSWGPDAATYNPERFLTEDPPIGTSRYITWGLNTPHLCPGRWFAWEVIQILTLNLFRQYSITVDHVVMDKDKYKYNSGNVAWRDSKVKVKKI